LLFTVDSMAFSCVSGMTVLHDGPDLSVADSACRGTAGL
jgi:hypothetical protein